MDLSDLPDLDDRNAIVHFAASFNGYEHYGSFKTCAEEAKKKNRRTLIELRNELFFSYRASNHRMDNGIVDTYRELLPYFQKLLSEKN